jgi:hypothetical protein
MKFQLDEGDLAPILEAIDQAKKEILMANEGQFAGLAQRLDAVTNQLADQLRGLRDQIKDEGLSSEQEDSAIATLDASIKKLEALGADPANPVPLEQGGTPVSQTPQGSQVEGSPTSATNTSPSSTSPSSTSSDSGSTGGSSGSQG